MMPSTGDPLCSSETRVPHRGLPAHVHQHKTTPGINVLVRVFVDVAVCVQEEMWAAV
jgi:hypothetical protein